MVFMLLLACKAPRPSLPFLAGHSGSTFGHVTLSAEPLGVVFYTTQGVY